MTKFDFRLQIYDLRICREIRMIRSEVPKLEEMKSKIYQPHTIEKVRDMGFVYYDIGEA